MQISFIHSIHDVEPKHWNSLCGPEYPFCRHEFLAALEDSGCTTKAAGWQVAHLIVREGEQVIAAMPGYVKAHSYGEYVFDWAWADAYHRHGRDYYPKWISAIPFTPCTGPRVLTKVLSSELVAAISSALNVYCEERGYSGWHCLFPDESLSHLFKAHSLERVGCQFHWLNKSYAAFDDFLAEMASRKRKNILKERHQVQAQGIHFDIKQGADISPFDMAFFYQLYRTTYLKRSGHSGYLSEAFFQRLIQTFNEFLVLVCALHNGKPIAASLFFRDEKTLYGRYWGCFEEFQFLHFETCYYQGIDYAIANSLQRFDGGAQGEHKIARGFEPVITYSNHYLSEPMFQKAIADFIGREANHIQRYREQAQELLPFKADVGK